MPLLHNPKNNKTMKRTIGGERLGSGRKMEANIKEYGRSTFNYSYIWRSTASCGTLIPFLCEPVQPGDTWDITINNDTKTHPTLGPLFGSFKLQFDMFYAADRLYNGLLHNNPAGLGLDMAKVKYPVIDLKGGTILATTDLENFDLDNSQVNPSSLPAYLGIRGIGISDNDAEIRRKFNAVPILMYWDTVKNYYSNKQEEQLAVLHTPANTLIDSIDFIQFERQSLPVPAPGAGFTISDDPAVPGATAFTEPTNIMISWIGDPVTDKPKLEQIIFVTNQGDISLKNLTIGTPVLVDTNRINVVYNWNKFGLISVYAWRYQTPAEIGQGKPSISMFPISNIDDMRTYIMSNIGDTPVLIADGLGGGANLAPYKWLCEWSADNQNINNILSSQEGLALKTYQSDQYNNWLNSEFIDGPNGINAVTSIAVTDDKFTVEQLILSNKVYDMLNAIMISGGTYSDWQEVNWGIKPQMGMETPMYLGGLSKELEFGEVVSNSEANGQPLGTLAGKGITGRKHKGGKVILKAKENGWIMGIFSATPRIDYSQGNKWYVNLESVNDRHTPWLDGLGFQDLIAEKQAWWTTIYNNLLNKWEQKTTGKEPAWMDYRTTTNKVYGNFAIATSEMFMILNRRYEPEYTAQTAGNFVPSIKDNTTYIDPSKFNFIFAETSLDAQNLWVQIGLQIELRRVMSARVMPNL